MPSFTFLTTMSLGPNPYIPMKQNRNQTSLTPGKNFKRPIFDAIVSFISRLF